MTEISWSTDTTAFWVRGTSTCTWMGTRSLLTDPGTEIKHEWVYPGLTWTDGQGVEVRLTVNRAPTAGPTITGDVQVGGTLTADPSAIVDPDGIATGATYTYQWVRVDGMNETNISGATPSSYTLVADDGGKTIKVKVSYTDEANFVDTATSNATTKVATAPAPPTGVDITTEGNGELTVGWTAPTENGGSDITGYKVQWKSGTQSFGSSRQHTTADGAATSYTILSLTNGTEYTVRVLAVNAVGDSAASNTDCEGCHHVPYFQVQRARREPDLWVRVEDFLIQQFQVGGLISLEDIDVPFGEGIITDIVRLDATVRLSEHGRPVTIEALAVP